MLESGTLQILVAEYPKLTSCILIYLKNPTAAYSLLILRLLHVTFLTEKYQIGLLFVKLNRFPFLKLFKLSVHLNCAATSLIKTINFIYFFISRSLPKKWITGRKVQPERHGSFNRQIRTWFSNIQDESFLQSECIVLASGWSKCHYSLLCKANQNRRGDLHNLSHNLGLSQCWTALST